MTSGRYHYCMQLTRPSQDYGGYTPLHAAIVGKQKLVSVRTKCKICIDPRTACPVSLCIIFFLSQSMKRPSCLNLCIVCIFHIVCGRCFHIQVCFCIFRPISWLFCALRDAFCVHPDCVHTLSEPSRDEKRQVEEVRHERCMANKAVHGNHLSPRKLLQCKFDLPLKRQCFHLPKIAPEDEF